MIGSWTCWTGRIGAQSLVIARTEQGPINAAASTAFAIDRFHPAAIVDQGTAGAHNPGYDVFDIVLGANTMDFSGYKSDHKDADRRDPVESNAARTAHRWARYEVIHRVSRRSSPARGRAQCYLRQRQAPRRKYWLRLLLQPTDRFCPLGPQDLGHRFGRRVRKTCSEDMESACAAGVAVGRSRFSPSASSRIPNILTRSSSAGREHTARSSSSA